MLKQVEKKDENGNTIICTVDENGMGQGPFEKHFKNGNIGRGSYKDGNWDGPYEEYYSNGQICAKATFKNGDAEGPYEVYYISGQIKVKGAYKNDYSAGPWEYYYENGQLEAKGNNDTYKEGPWEYYYENGQLRAKGELHYNYMEGLWEHYYLNGQLQEKGIYSNGEPAEILEAYDHSGKLIQPDIYSDGTKKVEKEKLLKFRNWQLKEERLAEKEVEKKQHEEDIKRAEAIGGLKGQLKMLSDPAFRKPIGKARTPERQTKAKEIVEVRRARTLLSRAAKKALDKGDQKLFSAIEEVARPYALHNRRIELEFRKKRTERRTKKGRG